MSNTYIAGMEASEFYSREASKEVDMTEGRDEAVLNNAAQGLAKRKDQTGEIGSHTDYVAEDNLLAKQRDLSDAAKRGDLLAVDRLEQECLLLASQLCGDAHPQSGELAPSNQEESTAEVLKAEYGEQHINETLQWSADSLSSEVAEALNEELAGDGAQAHVAYSALDNLRKNPELVTTDQIAPFDIAIANQLAEEYGSHGETIAAVNAALCAGKCTRAQAARMILSDETTARVAMQAAQSGLIKLAL